MDPATDLMTLFDLDGKKCGSVTLPKRREGQEPRSVIWHGRAFSEGGGRDNFYGDCEMAEQPKEGGK